MDAEVAFIPQVGQNPVWDGADAHLQRRAVVDQSGHLLADLPAEVSRLA